VIVVRDTAPPTALISLGRTEMLHTLFGDVLIPPSVEVGLRRFHSALPEFVLVQSVVNTTPVEHLELGAAEAIVLAQEMRAGYLPMDEIAGRDVARQRGLQVLGLLGNLLEAKKHRVIDSVRKILDHIGSPDAVSCCRRPEGASPEGNRRSMISAFRLKNVVLLGTTGSIGVSTQKVAAGWPAPGG
jgi:uncharacterized protein